MDARLGRKTHASGLRVLARPDLPGPCMVHGLGKDLGEPVLGSCKRDRG